MSSFNINGPSSNRPSVQGSQNLGKDGGGGGSTGYMNMRKDKKKEEKKKEEEKAVFLEQEADTFERQEKPKKKGNLIGTISNLIKDSKEQEKEENKEPEEEIEEEDEFSFYNMRLEKTVDPFEDSEYEIIDDDDYYGNMDV